MGLVFALLFFCRAVTCVASIATILTLGLWSPNKSRERTVDDVLTEALRYRGFWGNKGGITVSGGEALLQIDFLIALFTKAKEKGIHCTLDTCALPFRNKPRYLEKFNKLMAVTDLVLLDIKEINEEQHKIVTSQTNKNILACAQYLSDIGKPVWIRHGAGSGIDRQR